MASLRLAAVALLACVVGGCADRFDVSESRETSGHTDDARRTGPESRSSPQEGHPEPFLTEAARAHSLRGAEAFARYYIELLNYAANTGDVGRLRGAAHDCSGCTKYEELYRQVYERGGYMEEPGWRPVDVFAVNEGATSAGVLVTVRAPRMRYKLSKNAEEKIGARDVYKLRFELSRRGGEWAVTDFGTQTEIK